MYPGILSGLQQPGSGSPFDAQPPLYPQPFGLMQYGGGQGGMGHMGMQPPGDIQKQKGMLDYLMQIGGSPLAGAMFSKYMGGGATPGGGNDDLIRRLLMGSPSGGGASQG